MVVRAWPALLLLACAGRTSGSELHDVAAPRTRGGECLLQHSNWPNASDAPFHNVWFAGGKSDPDDAMQDDSVQHHHSIFQLLFEQVDRRFFWVVFGIMIVFIILVDRAQALAERHCVEEREKMFLNRINAELMMFGCVGLCLFILEQSLSPGITQDRALLIEFADILTSLGAVNLIGVAAWLLVCSKAFCREWKYFENFSSLPPEHRVTRCIRQCIRVLPGCCCKMLDGLFVADGEVFGAMADVFRSRCRLPPKFRYDEYLGASFVGNSCYIMNVRWFTWCSLLVFPVLRHCLHRRFALHYASLSANSYLVICAVFNWLNLCNFLFLLVFLYHTQRALTKYVKNIQVEGATLQKPIAATLASAIKVLIQAACLYNSTLFSIFLMLEYHNLHVMQSTGIIQDPSKGHFILLLPIVLSMLLLPQCLKLFTVIDAFFNPNADLIDSVSTKMFQAEHDLVNIRTQWWLMGEPTTYQATEELDEIRFTEFLVGLGLYLRTDRIRRIFTMLDEDADGIVRASEFFDLIHTYPVQLRGEPQLKLSAPLESDAIDTRSPRRQRST